MENIIKFSYFYGEEADKYAFYRIPKQLFTNPYFKELSSDAKILYGLFLDRMSLSIKNQWLDEENRAYIYFSVEDIADMLGCGSNKALKCVQELDVERGIGLIERKRVGQGKPTRIYVKNFAVSNVSGWDEARERNCRGKEDRTLDNKSNEPSKNKENAKQFRTAAEVVKSSSKDCEVVDSFAKESTDSASEDSFERDNAYDMVDVDRVYDDELCRDNAFDFVDPGRRYADTDVSNAREDDESEYVTKRIVSGYNKNDGIADKIPVKEYKTRRYIDCPDYERIVDENRSTLDRGEYDATNIKIEEYRQILKDNIEYDILVSRFPVDKPMIDEMLEIMMEVEFSQSETFTVAGTVQPEYVVKTRFRKINFFHIQYILGAIKENTTKIRNIKRYMMTALFNAPATMSGYYLVEVSHDMYEDAKKRIESGK